MGIAAPDWRLRRPFFIRYFKRYLMSIFSISDHINDVKRDDVDYATFLMFIFPANMPTDRQNWRELSRCVYEECDERSGAWRVGPAGAPMTAPASSRIPVQPAAFLTSASNLRFAVQTTWGLHFPTEHSTAKTQICCYYATVGDITETVRAHGERRGWRWLEVPGARFAAVAAALSPVRRMLSQREFSSFKAAAKKEVCCRTGSWWGRGCAEMSEFLDPLWGQDAGEMAVHAFKCLRRPGR